MARANAVSQLSKLSPEELATLQQEMIGAARDNNALDLETNSGPMDGPLLETPVEELGVVQDDFDLSLEPLEPIETMLGAPSQEEVGVLPEDQVELAQREAERVQAPLEASGIEADLSNMEDKIGRETAERFRDMAWEAKFFSPVTTPVAYAASFGDNFQPNAKEYSEGLEAAGAQELEKNPEGFVRMHKDLPLQANRTNIMTHSKGLGIGIRNPNFKASEVKVDSAGKVSNYSELSNVQPTIIDPRAIPNIAATVEDYLYNKRSEAEQSDAEAMLDMSNPANDRPDNSPQAFGRKAFQTIRRDRAYRNGEPTDSYLEDYQGTTPAAFEAISHTILDLYANIAPNMVTVNEGNWAEGRAKTYELSPEGRLILDKSIVKVPDFKADFLQTKPTDGAYQYENSLLKTSTGVVPSPESQALAETRDNMSSVPIVIDKRRGDLILMLGVSAFGTTPMQFRSGGEVNYTQNMIDIGPQRIAKIQAIAPRMIAERDQLMGKAETASGPRQLALLDEVAAKDESIARFLETGTNPETGTNSMRALFFQEANKSLEVLSTILNQGDKPFYHTFVTQTVTQRLHTLQQGTFQQHHLMRQAVGSGVKYAVKPLGGSQIETNFLENVSVIFFNGGKLKPEAQLSTALGHIRSNSPTYKGAVAMGTKLKKYLSEFNRDKAQAAIAGLRVTPKGLEGIKGLVDVRPEGMAADVELNRFLETLASQPKSHHNSIQVLDYLMALSDYEAARIEGTSAHLSVSPVEIDGISNGLASFVLSLGLEDQQYRTGVLRAEGANEVLGFWKDLPSTGDLSIDSEYKGDLRDTLDQMLKQNLSNEVSSLVMFQKEFQEEHNYSEEDIPALRKLLELANQDKANFRKSPMLTFAYGQEAHNLIDSVYDTITSNPVLLASAEAFPNGGGVVAAANFLQGVRHQALEFSLGPDVMEMQGLLKEGVEYGQLYGTAISVNNPAGGSTSFTGKETQYTGATSDLKTTKPIDKTSGKQGKRDDSLNRRIAKADRQGNKKLAETLRGQLSTSGSGGTSSMLVKEKVSRRTPLASRGGISGGQARGQVGPAMAQSLDGAAMVKTFSGDSWKKMSAAVGGQPFLLPIFDAIIPDLGSQHVAREAINKNWFDMASKAQIFKDFGDSVGKAASEGPAIFRKLAKERTGVINEAEHGMLADHLVSLLTFKDFGDDASVVNQAKLLREELQQHKDDKGVVINEARTYQALEQAQRLLARHIYSNFKPNYSKLMERSEAGRKKIISKVREGERTGQEVLQYAADDIGLSSDVLSLLR